MSSESPPITSTLNGEPRSLERALSVAELVARLDLRSDQVAVEVNRALVRRAEHGTRELRSGDVVEVVTLVGGG